MAYQTYITEALVCGSYDSNTADRTYLLFAREAGMVLAYAKSVREERSKQRYALQICMHIRATLVRGKAGWRLAGVEPIESLYAAAVTREARALLRNSVLLLRRVIRGETAHTEIFDDVLTVLKQSGVYDPEKLETVLAFRILHALGYVDAGASGAVLLSPQFPYTQLDVLTDAEYTVYREAIAHALTQSQL
jgi:recombinational DNA repair protein (RecF pathway)